MRRTSDQGWPTRRFLHAQSWLNDGRAPSISKVARLRLRSAAMSTRATVCRDREYGEACPPATEVRRWQLIGIDARLVVDGVGPEGGAPSGDAVCSRVGHGVYGAIAQLGERLLCKQEVTGSNPVGSIEVTGIGGPMSADLCSPIGFRSGRSGAPRGPSGAVSHRPAGSTGAPSRPSSSHRVRRAP